MINMNTSLSSRMILSWILFTIYCSSAESDRSVLGKVNIYVFWNVSGFVLDGWIYYYQ